jgi:hypothetical protein
MMKGRKHGTIAALAGTTATLAMLSGLSAAHADGLQMNQASDLQVNQQLIDQRVDQLAAGLFVGTSVPGSTDVNASAGSPVTAGSFPRSILIPGTDTSIKIYGEIREMTTYFFTGSASTNGKQSSGPGVTGDLESTPLEGTVARARSNGVFESSPRESRIGFETRTPTPYGEARTLMEFDWAGGSNFSPGGEVLGISDSLTPRLRYAYGTLGGLLAGQATSNFSDPDANGETLDFGGPAGLPGVVRIPQIRYTMPAWWGSSFSVSAETPETNAATTVGVFASDQGAGTVTGPVTVTCPGVAVGATATCTTVGGNVGFATNPLKSTAPDLTAAWYLPQAWGHFDASAVLLPGLDVEDGKFVSRSFIGYGGHLGADVKPGWFGWVKDDIVAQFEVGTGLGHYVNASTAVSLETNYPVTAAAAPATPAAAALVIIHPVTEIGGQLGYQHWWLDNLRSSIIGGIDGFNVDAPAVGGAAASTSVNKELMTAHANLIWNPVSFVDVGVEYVWGQRTAVTNAHATMNALISKFGFRF